VETPSGWPLPSKATPASLLATVYEPPRIVVPTICIEKRQAGDILTVRIQRAHWGLVGIGQSGNACENIEDESERWLHDVGTTRYRVIKRVTRKDDQQCDRYTHVRVVFPVELTTAVTALAIVFQEASWPPGLLCITSSSTNILTGTILKTLAWLLKHPRLACALDEVRSKLRPTVKS
jgi:hypothetical protein